MAHRSMTSVWVLAQMGALLTVLLGAGAAGAEEIWFDCLIDPARTAEVGSPASGILQQVLVRRGDRVEEGQPLARLDSAVESATVDLLRTRIGMDATVDAQRQQLALHERRRERMVTLRERGIASEDAVEQVETDRLGAVSNLRQAELDLALAEKELARAEIALDRRTIRSPFDGVVQRLARNEGEFVDGNDPILELVQLDPLRIEAYLPISMFERVTTGAKAELRPIVPADGAFEAVVVVIDPIFDAASGTFGVELSLSNPEQRVPAGQSCRIRVVG